MLSDFNDLHVTGGIDQVRALLLAATQAAAVELPPPPSEGAAPPDEAAATQEGVGERIFQNYALVEGKTTVFDLRRRIILKKSAFEALVTKAVAKDWYDRADKKLIAEGQARMLEDRAKLAEKARAVGADDSMPFAERYIYIDGTRDIWDAQKRRRIPEGALKLALGDAFVRWVNSPERRVVDVDNLVFDPKMTLDPATHLNTFEGLPLTPGTDFSRCAGIVQLIKSLCNRDEAATHFLTCWLAYPLQNVGTKLATAILLHSTMEGSGKSLLLSDIMRDIYGQYGATVGQVQLESGWSMWQSNKLYGIFEEVVSRDQRYNQTGKIKHMVTGKTFRIESKFMNGWEEANYMNSAFLSNEILPWPISENDRRLFVVWPERKLGIKLRDRVLWEMKNGGIEAFFGYLLQYNVGEFNSHTEPPRTPARDRLVALSRSSWQSFIAEWRSGLLGVPWDICVSSDLYALHLEWCQRNKEHAVSHTKFSGFVSTEVPKTPGMPWVDGLKRAFGTFFMPVKPLEPGASPPHLPTAAELGKLVEDFRRAARSAGWSVDDWAHIKPKGTT